MVVIGARLLLPCVNIVVALQLTSIVLPYQRCAAVKMTSTGLSSKSLTVLGALGLGLSWLVHRTVKRRKALPKQEEKRTSSAKSSATGRAGCSTNSTCGTTKVHLMHGLHQFRSQSLGSPPQIP
jgi:hypothetical protein